MSQLSARNCARPGSILNGRENTARRRGRSWRSPSANCRNRAIERSRDYQGTMMAHADATQATGEMVSPRRRSLASMLETQLGTLVEIPAALLVVAEIVTLFAGVVSRYGLQRPLICSDELASILFLWLAMLGSVVAFRRSEHMRMTAVVRSGGPALRAYLDVVG